MDHQFFILFAAFGLDCVHFVLEVLPERREIILACREGTTRVGERWAFVRVLFFKLGKLCLFLLHELLVQSHFLHNGIKYLFGELLEIAIELIMYDGSQFLLALQLLQCLLPT